MRIKLSTRWKKLPRDLRYPMKDQSGNTLNDRSSEVAGGGRSFEAPIEEISRDITGTIPKSNRDFTRSQTVASIQANRLEELHDVARRASRDREVSGPSGLHVRDFLGSNQRDRRSNYDQHSGSNLAERNMPENYPHDYREAEPRHFEPGSEFHQRRDWGSYPKPHADNRYDRDPRHNPCRGQNPVYRLYDLNDDSYPYPSATGNYRSRDHYPHVTFDPVLDSAPFDHGCVPQDSASLEEDHHRPLQLPPMTPCEGGISDFRVRVMKTLKTTFFESLRADPSSRWSTR